MSAALFNDQPILAGQKLGISTAKAILLGVMASGLAAMNVYHMGNAVTSKLLAPESSIFAYALLYFIACCIAFMEVPVTEEIVTQEARGRKARGHRLMLAVIVTMAIGAGLYSITSDADKRSSTIAAHETAGLSYQDRAQALISDRNIARAGATDSAGRSQANADYYRALAALRLEQSGHQSTRPALAVKTDSVFHWIWAIGFSLLCSLGVVVITAYLTKYHKPLTEIPRVFFKTREDQAWAMNDDDVRVIPAHVDLAGGSSTGAARKAISTPSSQSKNNNLTSSSKRDAPNRPAPDTANAGAVLNDEKSVSDRPLNQNPERAVQVEYSNDHYLAVKKAVISKEISPAQKPVCRLLTKLNIKFVDDSERTKKAIEIIENLKAENVLIDNEKFGNSGGKVVAKYKLNPDHENEQSEQGDNIASDDIETVCPKCKQTEIIERSAVAKSGGKVRSACGHVYSVNGSRWQVSPMVGAGVGFGEDGFSPMLGLGAMLSKR